jgi:feruloyl esterase
VSTDTGHSSTPLEASWASNAPEKVTNWGYRALHGSTVLGKEITKAYYGNAPAYSYYSGCSTGGRQGLKEAEMFPEDFDGIVAGAPAWWTVHLQLWNMKVGLYNLPTTAPYHIPDNLFAAIGAEVLKQCDPQDGVADNVISDPARCDFRPEALLCAANVTNATASGCLTSPQIDTLYHLYNDWVEANQTFIFPHFELGSEAQWDLLVGGDELSSLGTYYIKYMLGLGPDWDWRNFNPGIIALSEKINPGNATADNFDLSPFYIKGGKLLHYHGYADGSIATGSSIYFYNHVLRTLSPKGIDLDNFYRFFLVPGMQ